MAALRLETTMERRDKMVQQTQVVELRLDRAVEIETGVLVALAS